MKVHFRLSQHHVHCLVGHLGRSNSRDARLLILCSALPHFWSIIGRDIQFEYCAHDTQLYGLYLALAHPQPPTRNENIQHSDSCVPSSMMLSCEELFQGTYCGENFDLSLFEKCGGHVVTLLHIQRRNL